MNIQSRTKQNLPTSLTLKTKSPLAKSFKAVHPQLAWDPGSNKVQELLPSRRENEIPDRCGPGVKKQKVNRPHPSLDSTSVKTEININSSHYLVWRWAEFPPVVTTEYHVVRTAAELIYCETVLVCLQEALISLLLNCFFLIQETKSPRALLNISLVHFSSCKANGLKFDCLARLIKRNYQVQAKLWRTACFMKTQLNCGHQWLTFIFVEHCLSFLDACQTHILLWYTQWDYS